MILARATPITVTGRRPGGRGPELGRNRHLLMVVPRSKLKGRIASIMADAPMEAARTIARTRKVVAMEHLAPLMGKKQVAG